MALDAHKQLPAGQRRRVRIFPIVLLLVLCASMGSCLAQNKCALAGDDLLDDVDGGDPYCFTETEIENPRFETPSLPGTVPSLRYWLAPGDQLAPAFDTFELHYQRLGKICDFHDNTPVSANGDCLVCDLCGDLFSPGCKEKGLQTPKGEIGPGTFDVVADVGFMTSPLTHVIF